MPPSYVNTIREKILYEYAKLISRSACGGLQRGFIIDCFKKLRDGEITISGTIREWEQEMELPQKCVYCGSTINLTTDHLIPKNKGGEILQTMLFWPASRAIHLGATKEYLNGLG